jgi:hypothetical protein
MAASSRVHNARLPMSANQWSFPTRAQKQDPNSVRSFSRCLMSNTNPTSMLHTRETHAARAAFPVLDVSYPYYERRFECRRPPTAFAEFAGGGVGDQKSNCPRNRRNFFSAPPPALLFGLSELCSQRLLTALLTTTRISGWGMDVVP